MKVYPITRQLERREIKNTPDYETLLAWAKEKGITFGETITIEKAKFDLLQLLWVYQDVEVIKFKDIPPTNLITYGIQPKERIKVYRAKDQKLSQDRE